MFKEAHLAVWYSPLLPLSRHCGIFFSFFNKLKVCGNLFDAGESVRVTFLAGLARFMSLRHILVMLTIFRIFHDYYICYCGLWSVICDVTALTHWRFR